MYDGKRDKETYFLMYMRENVHKARKIPRDEDQSIVY